MKSGKIAPFDDQPGVWLRTALHVHTTETDGWLTPEVQRRYHSWGGFDALTLTDHDMFTVEPRGDDALILLGGTEISLRAPKSGGPLHVLGLGIERMPVIKASNGLGETAEAIRAVGGLPYLAHPVWSGLRTDEVDGIEECEGVEIFNASSDIEQDRGHNDAHTDVWLSMGHKLKLIATDDTHYPGFDSFRAWTMVHATERSGKALLDAMAAGRFYSSCGPRITSLEIVGDCMTVRTTPVSSINALANPPYGAGIRVGRAGLAYHARRLPTIDGQTLEGYVDGESLSGATFSLVPGVKYVRLAIQDHQGNRAWSNPIWVE